MRKICIAHEEASIDHARGLANHLKEYQVEIDFISKICFPVADTMNSLLWSLAQYSSAFIIISGTRGASISRELKIQQNMGSYKNVYPVFLSNTDIPVWWSEREDNFLVIDSLVEQAIRKYLDELPVADPQREAEAKVLFPYQRITAEAYAAGEGHRCAYFSFGDYCYVDPKLNEWIHTLDDILFTPGKLRRIQEKLLSAQDLAKIREEMAEEL